MFIVSPVTKTICTPDNLVDPVAGGLLQTELRAVLDKLSLRRVAWTHRSMDNGLSVPRPLLGYLLAARSGHRDFAVYYERFHYKDTELAAVGAQESRLLCCLYYGCYAV
ncbi:hypothetical protein ACMFMG_006138 [Clarireedia jacksonii]